MQSVDVFDQINIVDDVLDDLAERQRYDRQIVAAQTQDRDTDQHACHACDQSADQDRQRETDPDRSQRFLCQDAERAADERAQAHEACVSEAQFAEDADGQVQGNCHDDIGTDRDEKSLDQAGAARQSVIYHAEHEARRNNGVSDHILLGCLV